MPIRRICFVITSGIHYGRSKTLLEELTTRSDVELKLVVGGSALLSNYGDILSVLERDGFQPHARVFMTLEGGNLLAMAKTAGLGVSEFASVFDNLKPDVVMVRGDRYEVLSAAVAAAYLNIPIAHIEGGDISGTLDESVRHAITKLSHIHFATNPASHERILRMGEDPRYVFLVGSPELDFVIQNNFSVTTEYMNSLGVGDVVDTSQRFILVMQHPVTTEVGENRHHTEETLEAVQALEIPAIWFWPNVDAGTDEVSKAIRVFREQKRSHRIRFLKYLPPEQFIGLLKKSSCLIGNSSAGLKECSLLGVPAVNIGTRQYRRLRGPNVVDVDYDKTAIRKAIEFQLEHGPYPPSDVYYRPQASRRIAELVATVPLYIQKTYYDGEGV